MSELVAVAQRAQTAFLAYRSLGKDRHAAFLNAIAQELEARAEAIVPVAMRESSLPEARLRGELGRTTGQLRMFARVVAEGSWVDARIDTPDPARIPPKPDVRSMLEPLGPVVVFGASNFPLAFSVPGGDTASALAAGCSVIAKAHPAHPETSQLCADAILAAAQSTGMPEGTFQLVVGGAAPFGQELVSQPAVAAAAFTGSRAAGLALAEAARTRPVPIPFYAEMSSVNPLVILPGALQDRGDEVAAGLAASVTLGVGQFCTNPGLVFAVGETAAFREALARRLNAAPAAPMLTPAIADNYMAGRAARDTHRVTEPDAFASLFAIDAATFHTHVDFWQEEVFGPATVLVQVESLEKLPHLLAGLHGGLTASIFATPEDEAHLAELVPVLREKAGRLVFNQYPTGVEVGSAMVHGGPFPSTTDPRTTSVGERAILRFVRPVCYQGFPNSALPPALQDGNPLGIARLIDGRPA